jgi:Fungal chitosanase of glycosyl hydrolase group 75
VRRTSSALVALLSVSAPGYAQGTAPVLEGLGVEDSAPIDDDYKAQFLSCDRYNTFRGIRLTGNYRCKRVTALGKDASDFNNVTALSKLKNGAVLWQSKMALDVDGAWAAWHLHGGPTDQKETSMKWSDVSDKHSEEAQINPDQIPFVVIPMDGLPRLTGNAAGKLGREFANKTGLRMGDFGVVVYHDKWTPAIIADGGPFIRLGEASSKVFEALGADRCKAWSEDRTHCIGKGGYPYTDSGIGKGVVFIFYPGSAGSEMTAANAISTMCDWARQKLGKTGSPTCP